MLETWHNRGLADALGTIREEIRALKMREAELRKAILAAPLPEAEGGAEFALRIKRGTSRRFNRDALPPDILDDPRYWTTQETVTVSTPRVGRVASDSDPEEEDFDVIEPL